MASANDDAHRLRNAIKGLGTDDAVLVDIIAHRSNEQLQQVASAYVGSFGKTLVEDIKGDTSGNYKDLLVALVEPKPAYYARIIHDAVKGVGTNEGALIDAVVHLPNVFIRAVQDAYRNLYKKSLSEDVANDTSGDFKKVLVGILNATRDETPAVNVEQAARDAEHLYKKGEGKIGTDESAFIEFFITRSWAHIRETDRVYTQLYKHPLSKAIHSEFSGDIRTILKALAVPRAVYFAGRIHSAIQGLGTDDTRLIRAFALNNREQLREIEAAYSSVAAKKKGKKKTKKDVSGSLVSDVKGDTSGNYEKTLLALLH